MEQAADNIPREQHFDMQVDRGYLSQAIDSDLQGCYSHKVNSSRDLRYINIK